MPKDFASTLFIVFCFALTFIVARTLSRGFRARRKEKEDARREAERRATETRQVRRQRERRAK
jgi:hypothetical protein